MPTDRINADVPLKQAKIQARKQSGSSDVLVIVQLEDLSTIPSKSLRRWRVGLTQSPGSYRALFLR